MAEQDEILSSFADLEYETDSVPKILTVLPLRDIIIFPHMIFPILIGRPSSLKAVAEAVERDKFIFVSAQKNPAIEDPAFKDIYRYGTISKIIQVLRLPNNLLKVLVEGLFQSRIEKQVKNKEFLEAQIKRVNLQYNPEDQELQAMIRHSSDLFSAYVKQNHNLPSDLYSAFDSIDDPSANCSSPPQIFSRKLILNR